MGTKVIIILAFVTIVMQDQNVNTFEDQLHPIEKTESLQFNPFNQNWHKEIDYSKEQNENLSRVKRQYSNRRDRYYPLPIIGGGIGYPAIGSRGFGQRGYGGRGFAARGARGRGTGGRGIGGRGIAGRGIGGRGGIGGGRGGRG